MGAPFVELVLGCHLGWIGRNLGLHPNFGKSKTLVSRLQASPLMSQPTNSILFTMATARAHVKLYFKLLNITLSATKMYVRLWSL